ARMIPATCWSQAWRRSSLEPKCRTTSAALKPASAPISRKPTSKPARPKHATAAVRMRSLVVLTATTVNRRLLGVNGCLLLGTRGSSCWACAGRRAGRARAFTVRDSAHLTRRPRVGGVRGSVFLAGFGLGDAALLRARVLYGALL